MNEKGLFIELNNGAYSDPSYIEGVENTVSVLVTALNQCSTIDEASEYLLQTQAELSYIIQIADAKECDLGTERPSQAAEKDRTTGRSSCVQQFVHHTGRGGQVGHRSSGEIDPRYSNLISCQLDGSVQLEFSMRTLDIEVRDGAPRIG